MRFCPSFSRPGCWHRLARACAPRHSSHTVRIGAKWLSGFGWAPSDEAPQVADIA
jgi:hypothetical protein